MEIDKKLLFENILKKLNLLLINDSNKSMISFTQEIGKIETLINKGELSKELLIPIIHGLDDLNSDLENLDLIEVLMNKIRLLK